MLSKQLLEDINQVVNPQFYTYINIQRLNEAIENGEELIDFDELLTEEASKCGLAAGKIASVLKKHLKVVNPLTIGLLLVLSGQAGCVGKNLPQVLKHSNNLSKKIESSSIASKITKKSRYLFGDEAKKYPKSSQNKMMRNSERLQNSAEYFENIDPATLGGIEGKYPIDIDQKTESGNDRLYLYAKRLVYDILPAIEEDAKKVKASISGSSDTRNIVRGYLKELKKWSFLYIKRKEEIEKIGKPNLTSKDLEKVTKLPDFPKLPKELKKHKRLNQFYNATKLDVFSKGNVEFYHNLEVTSSMRFSAANNYPSIERALKEGSLPTSLSKVIKKELSGIKNKKFMFVSIQEDVNPKNEQDRDRIKYAKGLLGVTFPSVSGIDLVYVPNIDFTELSIYMKLLRSWYCVDIVNLRNYTNFDDHFNKTYKKSNKEKNGSDAPYYNAPYYWQHQGKKIIDNGYDFSVVTGENDEILNVKKMKTLFQVLPMLMHRNFLQAPDISRTQIERDKDKPKSNRIKSKFLNVRPYI